MEKNLKTLIIIPAYNEEASIADVLTSLKKELPEADILVVNDASTDDTEKKAESTDIAKVVTLSSNLGIGGAVQTGFKYAKNHGYDIAVQFDGDGQHIAGEIPTLTGPLLKNRADVVIGSRFLRKNKNGFRSSFTRRIGIFFFGIINSILIRQIITDNTSGFRAYNRKAIHFLAQNYPTDYPEPEAVILLGKNGFTLKEVCTEMKERENGVSSISSGDSLYYMIKVFLAVFINAIRSPV